MHGATINVDCHY